MNHSTPESPTIRPPSEWRSVLIRITRGCSWNRCRFCGLYPALGQPDFSVRSLPEIMADIDRLKEHRPDATTAFLGDADPLQIPHHHLRSILGHLRNSFDRLERITAYARASTLWKMKKEGIQRLREMGIDRVHVGLESGDRAVLRFQKKGQSPKMLVRLGQWLKDAEIEISLYVLLGLGGRNEWESHIDATAELINKVDPGFVRLRRLWLYRNDGGECPLWEEIRADAFVPQSPEGTVMELRRLVDNLKGVSAEILCDHANNYCQVKGKMPEDKERMLTEIDAFLSLPRAERERHYETIGNRI